MRAKVSKKPGKSMSSSRRINPDSIQTLWFTVGVVGFLAATSFMVSFAGLTEVARWVGVPAWMSWTVPAFIDMAILAYSLAVLIHRSRGEATWASWLSLGLFTLVSVVANAAHALSFPHENAWQAWIGASIAALAPVGVFAATEELGRLAVEQPSKNPGAVTDMGEQEPNSVPAAALPVQEKPVLMPKATTDSPALPMAETKPEPEDDPEDPAPEPEPTNPEPEARDEVEETTPLLGQAVQETVEPPAQEPVPVAHTADLPKLAVVPAPAAKGSVADLDKLTRFVQTEMRAGRGVPTAPSVAAHMGGSDRTARRKLAALKNARPDIFASAERKQA